MAKITFGDCDSKAKLGDKIELRTQTQEVVKCEKTGVLMLNIDPTEVRPGDLPFIKALGLTISNPDTTDPVAIGIDTVKGTLGDAVAMWWNTDSTDDSEFFDEKDYDYSDIASVLIASSVTRPRKTVAEKEEEDEDDDSYSSPSWPSFGSPSPSFGGFGGGPSFGGFGGGSFSGGGASSSW